MILSPNGAYPSYSKTPLPLENSSGNSGMIVFAIESLVQFKNAREKRINIKYFIIRKGIRKKGKIRLDFNIFKRPINKINEYQL